MSASVRSILSFISAACRMHPCSLKDKVQRDARLLQRDANARELALPMTLGAHACFDIASQAHACTRMRLHALMDTSAHLCCLLLRCRTLGLQLRLQALESVRLLLRAVVFTLGLSAGAARCLLRFPTLLLAPPRLRLLRRARAGDILLAASLRGVGW